MDLMCLNGLIRRAIKLVKGVDVTITEDTFEMAVTSIIPWFKVCIPNFHPLLFDALCPAQCAVPPVTLSVSTHPPV